MSSNASLHTLIHEVIQRVEWEVELHCPGYSPAVEMPQSRALAPSQALPLQHNPTTADDASDHAHPTSTMHTDDRMDPSEKIRTSMPANSMAFSPTETDNTETARAATPAVSITSSRTDAASDIRPNAPDNQSRARALAELKFRLEKCAACGFAPNRSRIVFSDGTMSASIAFVGDAPSQEEDTISLPFIGERGHLLNKIIIAIGQRRETSYLCNVFKCPTNANVPPSFKDIQTCSQFLFEQLTQVAPKVIVALGQIPASALLDTQADLATLRGTFHTWRDIPVMATWSLETMLKIPATKREVWDDMKQVKTFLEQSRR